MFTNVSTTCIMHLLLKHVSNQQRFPVKGDDIIKLMQDTMQDNCKWLLHNAVFDLKRANKVKLDLQCPCAIN